MDEAQVVARTEGGKAAAVSPASILPPSILIVENEALVASAMEDVLGESGFRIVGIAGSGVEALSLAAESRPSLALVDIRLSGPIDGIELACLLHQKFGLRTIFSSALLDDATAERAQAAQPLGFLPKPVRPSQMFNLIEDALTSLRA
ncbi:MAG TPA: response regulator [Stellaceae bacterium]|nr:response regulator [Stellaceae bacterium]